MLSTVSSLRWLSLPRAVVHWRIASMRPLATDHMRDRLEFRNSPLARICRFGGVAGGWNFVRRNGLQTATQGGRLAPDSFIPKFYVLDSDNADMYANKNPVPSALSDVDPSRRVAIILHGILGTGRNWVPFTRKLLSHFPDWQFLLVDQRGHGESHSVPALNPASADGGSAASEHTVDTCARDVENLCTALGCSPEVVIGHSFGGKVALHYHMLAQNPPAYTWILDSHLAPFDLKSLMKEDEENENNNIVSVAGGGGGALECEPPRQPGSPNINMKPGTSTDIMTAIASIPTPIENRSQVKVFLTKAGFSNATVSWLLSNLRPVSEADEVGNDNAQLPNTEGATDCRSGGGTVGDKQGGNRDACPVTNKRKRLLTWRFDIGISRLLIEDASRVDSLPLLTRAFRPDRKGNVGIIRGLSGVQWEDAQLVRYQGCLRSNAENAAARASASASAAALGSGAAAGRVEESGRVEEYVIEAGHWIHVMKPDDVIAIMSPSLTTSAERLRELPQFNQP